MDIRTAIPTIYGDWAKTFGELWKTQTARVKEKFSDAIEEIRMPMAYATEVPIVYVRKEKIVDVLRFMKDDADFQYVFLADLTATDEESGDGSASAARFEVVYNLFSHESKSRIRLKVRLRENEDLPTVSMLWAGANWAEREVFDMFGVKFRGHPDLRRILMDERWVGHPLRKDYPLKGYQLFPEPEAIHKELLD